MTTSGSVAPEWDPQLRDRVRRLMRVLRAIAAAKTRPTRHTASCYGVQWLDKASEHLTVHPATEPGHEVLRAPRVVSEPAPELPSELRGWVEHSPRRLVEPVLKDYGPARYGDVVGIDERPEQRDRFARWRREWTTWAEAERVRRARAAIHDELFRMHHTAEDRPESVEVVLAGGLLHLPDPDTDGVHVHIVNQPVDLLRDVTTGDMVVTVTEAPPRLEDDEILAGDEAFDGSGGPMLGGRLDELASGVADPALASFLKEWRDRALTVACEVAEVVRLLEQDGWALRRDHRFPPSLRSSIEARTRDGRGQAERHLEAEDAVEHPEASRPAGGAIVGGYVVVFEGDDSSGYSAYSPDLPGVAAAGDSRAETEQLMRDAMASHLEELRSIGQVVPEPTDAVDVVVVDPSAV